MASPRRVEFVFDLACVFSYQMFTRYRRAKQRFRAAGGEVETVLLPYRFRPDADPAGEPLFVTHLRDRGEEAARAVQATTGFGAADGLRVDFTRVVSTNTFEAHRLIARAAPLNRGEAMAERLFRAYFTDGVNVADPAVLARLAAEVGVDPGPGGEEELRRELERVRGLDFVAEAVPGFRFDGGRVLNGEQSEEALLAALTG
ncbi:DsbA family protein [Streptomonospora sp. S1-112]|uniref:DsbA family protein n=1 Tax=Streptomonospora mangrovi TaxID=2883123 RepID=A0A9X3NSI5_9ACTN|nr:DsbA family protein [Streptomonospora mangrovi]MDA0563316.1 DsbA family protein [Streptomonospora mangrovi]